MNAGAEIVADMVMVSRGSNLKAGLADSTHPTRWFPTCYISSFRSVDQPACEPSACGYCYLINRAPQRFLMARMVRGGLIQATLCEPATSPVEKIKKAMIDKHVAMIEEAAQKGVE